jgi:hypothetical protein
LVEPGVVELGAFVPGVVDSGLVVPGLVAPGLFIFGLFDPGVVGVVFGEFVFGVPLGVSSGVVWLPGVLGLVGFCPGVVEGVLLGFVGFEPGVPGVGVALVGGWVEPVGGCPVAPVGGVEGVDWVWATGPPRVARPVDAVCATIQDAHSKTADNNVSFLPEIMKPSRVELAASL